MSVITISRGTMSGGKLIAEQLAQDLGYRSIDREVIVEKAAASGVSHNELRDAMEKPPTFLERFRHRKYLYLALIQAALAEEVRSGRAIYQGNAGHLLLKGGGPVFRVRIIAPMEFRIKMAQERLKFSREEAIDFIEGTDTGRRKWTQYLYGVDWTDSSLYDVVINLEKIDVRRASEAIGSMIRNQTCFHFDDKCRAIMNDLAIASRVKADLALNSATSHLEFDVTAKEGRVSIAGKIPDVNLVSEVERVASAVPGADEIVLDEILTPTQA